MTAKVSQSGVFLVDRTPERVVMFSHGFSDTEMQRIHPCKSKFSQIFFLSKKSQFKAAFEPVSDDRDFIVSNDIVRNKRQAEEFDAENNPTGKNVKDILTSLWQSVLDSGKKIIKTAAAAMDRTASEADME